MTVKLAVKVKGVAGNQWRSNVYIEDDERVAALVSWIRIVSCFLFMMVTTMAWAVIIVLLIPWTYERIRQGNVYGHVTGKMLMWILGNPIRIEGAEYSQEKAIYICNHCSPIDVFLIMWLVPSGTIGIAKKEIIWYPIFGQLYMLANHLRIDRSNPTAAIVSLKSACFGSKPVVVDHFPQRNWVENWSITAFQAGYLHKPITAKLCLSGSAITTTDRRDRTVPGGRVGLHVRPAPITVKFLHPI